MKTSHRIPATAAWLGGGIGLMATAYLAHAGWTWLRFGTVPPAEGAAAEPLLDSFMPDYDVVERHYERIDAPAADTLDVACGIDLLRSPLARAIFKARELALGGAPD